MRRRELIALELLITGLVAFAPVFVVRHPRPYDPLEERLRTIGAGLEAHHRRHGRWPASSGQALLREALGSAGAPATGELRAERDSGRRAVLLEAACVPLLGAMHRSYELRLSTPPPGPLLRGPRRPLAPGGRPTDPVACGRLREDADGVLVVLERSGEVVFHAADTPEGRAALAATTDQ